MATATKAFGEELARSIEDISGLEAELQQIDRLNGRYTGITVRRHGDPVGVVLRLDPYASRLDDNGSCFENVARMAVADAVRALSKTPGCEKLINMCVTAKDMVMEAVSTSRNREMLEDVPSIEICDLSVIFRISMDEGCSTVLNNAMMRHFGWDERYLLDCLLPEIADIRPADICLLGDVLREMTGNSIYSGPMEPGIYVASTEDRVYGSGILAYPGFLEMCAKKLGGSYYVLPSSIHECLLVPEMENTDREALLEMVTIINREEVDPEERLSDNVYHYDAEERVLTDCFGHAFRPDSVGA